MGVTTSTGARSREYGCSNQHRSQEQGIWVWQPPQEPGAGWARNMIVTTSTGARSREMGVTTSTGARSRIGRNIRVMGAIWV